MPYANQDDEINPAAADAINSATEDILSGLVGATAGSFKNAQSGLKLLKNKLDDHKESKSQELTIQLGRNVIFKAKPGQKSETVMSPEQGKKLNAMLQDPAKATGSLKISFGKEKILHISQGKIVADKLELLHETQNQKQTETQTSELEKPKTKDPVQTTDVEKEAQTQTPDVAQASDVEKPSAETQVQSEVDKPSTQTENQTPVGEKQAPEEPIPGLDNDYTPVQQKTEPIAEKTSSEAPEPEYQSPVGQALNSIDNAPGLPEPPADPIAQQNQIIQNTQPEKQAPALSKDEMIAQLREQLQTQAKSFESLSEQVTQLTDRIDNLSPIKLANEQVGGWVNKQRNKLAKAIRAGADRLAQGIEKHQESTAKLSQDVKDKVEKVKEGMDRHDQAVGRTLDKAADIRDKVAETVETVSQKTHDLTEKTKQTHRSFVNGPQYQKGKEFLSSVAEPAVRGVIENLERIGGVQKDTEGNRTLQSEQYDWTLTNENKVQITERATGEQIKPENLNQDRVNTLKTFAAAAQQKGYVQAPAQTQAPVEGQTQAPVESPKPAAHKAVAKV